MVFEKTLIQLRYIAVGVLYIALTVALIYIVSYIVIRRKKHRELEDQQLEILREGKINVKKFRLRSLFTSNNYANPLNEGKIVAYVRARDNDKDLSVFAVRPRPLSSIKFFVVGSDEHTKLFRDVTLKHWNFTLNEQKLFYVLNSIKVNRLVPYDKETKSFDTIGQMAPLVHKGILANFEHRIRLRERKLIKMPEEELRANR
jgi:hypothetical protein